MTDAHAHDSHEEHHDDHGHGGGHDDHGHGGGHGETLEVKLAKAAMNAGKEATDEWTTLQAAVMADVVGKAREQYGLGGASSYEIAQKLQEKEWKIDKPEDIFKNIQYGILKKKSPKLLEAYEQTLHDIEAAKHAHDEKKAADLEAFAEHLSSASTYLTGIDYKSLGKVLETNGANPLIFSEVGKEYVQERAKAKQQAYASKIDSKKVDSQLENMLQKQFPDFVGMSTVKDLDNYQRPEQRINTFIQYLGAQESGNYKAFKEKNPYLFKKAAAHGHDDHGHAEHH